MHIKGSFQLNTGWTMMVLMHCQTLLYHRTKIKKKAKQNVAFSQPLPQSIVLPYVKKILISLMHHLLIFIKPIFKDRRRRSCSIIPKIWHRHKCTGIRVQTFCFHIGSARCGKTSSLINEPNCYHRGYVNLIKVIKHSIIIMRNNAANIISRRLLSVR